MDQRENFLLKAYELGIIKFGSFTLKSGIQSPFYVDLRPLASSPHLLKTLSHNLLGIVENVDYELICGVPYAALPMATTMSLESGVPLIIKRKENKGYGTKRMVEGVFSEHQNCLLVEDVITSGKSLIETIDEVEKEGLKVTDIVVVLDRQQGGVERMSEKGYHVHTLFKIHEVIDILHKYHRLSDVEVERVKAFLNTPTPPHPKKKMAFEKRSFTHPIAKKLISIALKKQSNLIASADVITSSEVLQLANQVGDSIVALKLHSDIIVDFSNEFIDDLKTVAQEKEFLLFEDRKFGDIGNTQELQFKKGIYNISSWADMVTSHVIAGEKSLEVFQNIGVVTIVEMSSKGTLTNDNYIAHALNLSQKSNSVLGVVAQRKVTEDLLLFTPGVNIGQDEDKKGQQYNTPQKVIQDYHTDFIIVGRGIYKAINPKESAKKYQNQSWKAYANAIN